MAITPPNPLEQLRIIFRNLERIDRESLEFIESKGHYVVLNKENLDGINFTPSLNMVSALEKLHKNPVEPLLPYFYLAGMIMGLASGYFIQLHLKTNNLKVKNFIPSRLLTAITLPVVIYALFEFILVLKIEKSRRNDIKNLRERITLCQNRHKDTQQQLSELERSVVALREGYTTSESITLAEKVDTCIALYQSRCDNFLIAVENFDALKKQYSNKRPQFPYAFVIMPPCTLIYALVYKWRDTVTVHRLENLCNDLFLRMLGTQRKA